MQRWITAIIATFCTTSAAHAQNFDLQSVINGGGFDLEQIQRQYEPQVRHMLSDRERSRDFAPLIESFGGAGGRRGGLLGSGGDLSSLMNNPRLKRMVAENPAINRQMMKMAARMFKNPQLMKAALNNTELVKVAMQNPQIKKMALKAMKDPKFTKKMARMMAKDPAFAKKVAALVPMMAEHAPAAPASRLAKVSRVPEAAPVSRSVASQEPVTTPPVVARAKAPPQSPATPAGGEIRSGSEEQQAPSVARAVQPAAPASAVREMPAAEMPADECVKTKAQLEANPKLKAAFGTSPFTSYAGPMGSKLTQNSRGTWDVTFMGAKTAGSNMPIEMCFDDQKRSPYYTLMGKKTYWNDDTSLTLSGNGQSGTFTKISR